MTEKRRLSVLGATGSVGQSTMDLIRRNRSQYQLVALTANSSLDELVSLAREFEPEVVAIGRPELEEQLNKALSGLKTEILTGAEGIVEAAERPCDWTMAAIVGAAGLPATLAAVRQGGTVAFANKECLVCAGRLMMDEVRKHGTKLLPVDSEHNAIFQVFDSKRKSKIEKLILTGSGGPFRTWNLDEMASITREQALKHPNWSMGAKITIDSATMMNKGLEFVEACFLFDMPADQVDILVHPQSVIHSMVEYADGSVLAQLGSPDMRTPIAYCLAWPDRMSAPVEKLDFAALARLDFEAPDEFKFPAIRLARESLSSGDEALITLNAVNEIAVASFLNGGIGYLDIAMLCEKALQTTTNQSVGSIEDVIQLDQQARILANEMIKAQAA